MSGHGCRITALMIQGTAAATPSAATCTKQVVHLVFWRVFFPWTSLCCETETDAACARICVFLFLLFIYLSFLINFLPYLHHQSELFYISAVHVNTSPNSQNLSCRVKRSDNIHGDTSDHFSQSINRFLWRVGSKLCPGFIWVSLNSNQELCIYLLFNYIFIFSSHTSHISAHRSSCSSSISLIVHQLCLFPLWLWSGLQRRQQKAMTEGGGK